MKNKPFPAASEKFEIVPSLICAGAIYAPINVSVFLQVIHLEPNAPLWSSNPTPIFNYLEKSPGMNHPTRGIYAIKAFEARGLPHKKLGKSKCLLKSRMIWFPLLQGILQGALWQGKSCPEQKMGLKGVKPFTALLHL